MAARPRRPGRGKNRAPSDRPGEARHQDQTRGGRPRGPLALVLAGANRNDHLLLPYKLEQLTPPTDLGEPGGLCLDKGYDFDLVRAKAGKRGYQLHLRQRGEHRPEATTSWRPRRWVVERTFSWLHRFRLLLIR